LKILAALLTLAFSLAGYAQSSAPVRLNVDLTDAPRKIIHARMTMPVHPGPMTLLYPKWIPGEHGPTGPVTDGQLTQVCADDTSANRADDACGDFAVNTIQPANAPTAGGVTLSSRTPNAVSNGTAVSSAASSPQTATGTPASRHTRSER